MLGTSTSFVWDAIRSDEIPAVKVRQRVLIPEEYLLNLVSEALTAKGEAA